MRVVRDARYNVLLQRAAVPNHACAYVSGTRCPVLKQRTSAVAAVRKLAANFRPLRHASSFLQELPPDRVVLLRKREGAGREGGRKR
eukprot:2539040-Rhodomonas_salina.1